jgi:hypothetical protein
VVAPVNLCFASDADGVVRVTILRDGDVTVSYPLSIEQQQNIREILNASLDKHLKAYLRNTGHKELD